MRGMKKWLPFKSLNNQYEILNDYIQEKNKVAMPELSDDKQEEINERLTNLKTGDMVRVTYFFDGFILTKNLCFQKIDSIKRKIYFKSFSLDLKKMLDIE